MAVVIEHNGALLALPTAPAKLAPTLRSPLLVELPSGHYEQVTYAEAEALHQKLAQDLARGMRRRSSAAPPVDPDDDGGTPMAIAA